MFEKHKFKRRMQKQFNVFSIALYCPRIPHTLGEYDIGSYQEASGYFEGLTSLLLSLLTQSWDKLCLIFGLQKDKNVINLKKDWTPTTMFDGKRKPSILIVKHGDGKMLFLEVFLYSDDLS